MRRLTKKEFLLIDHEVVYCESPYKFEPEGLFIKMDSLGCTDFVYQELCGNTDAKNSDEHSDWLCKAETDSTFEIPLTFDCASRDGMFEDGNVYFVYSKDDLRQLLDRLQLVYDGMSS